MGNWYNAEWMEISVHNMDDVYVNNLIGFIAHGGGWSAEVVLGFVDDLYRAAKERNIIKGPVAWALKRYTVRLWERIARAGGRKYAWRTPRWVEWALDRYVPHREYGSGK